MSQTTSPISEQANPTLGRNAREGRQTEDEKLLRSDQKLPIDFTRTDPWRVLRIQGELVAGIDALAHIGPAVTVFGSARIARGAPFY
jgi:hypothetical protein